MILGKQLFLMVASVDRMLTNEQWINISGLHGNYPSHVTKNIAHKLWWNSTTEIERKTDIPPFYSPLPVGNCVVYWTFSSLLV